MKKETLHQALEQISDQHIAEAAQSTKRRIPRWIGAVAAALAVVILTGAIAVPMLSGDPPQAPAMEGTIPPTRPIATAPNVPAAPEGYYLQYLTASPVYPQMAPYPDQQDFWADGDPVSSLDEKYQQFDLAYDAWRQSHREQYDQPSGYADSAEAFFQEVTQVLLSDQGSGNAACSPVNVYMALAMLAETTGGDSRQQILTALGADSIEALRTQAGHIWNAHYCADNATTLTLANSLWLDESLSFKEEATQSLAENYYASVLLGQLGSEEMNEALRSWINEQTGGLLQQQAAGLEMDPQTIVALASTVYYRCKWDQGSTFRAANNTQGTFHSPQNNWTVTYMNQTLAYGPYYWGAHYSAACLNLEDGSRMWLILPDAGYAPTDLLEEGIVAQVLEEKQESTRIKVNLSLPKFDISANLQLDDSLQALGIQDVFGQNADFSGILEDTEGMAPYLSEASHATRVAIDEEGITAAAYTVMMEAGAAPPPEAEVDLVLDRPFLFLIESKDGLPLFAGIVNEP